MTNAILYARVSTEATKQDIDNQLIPLKKYAESLNFNITGEYLDYASGGDSNRPEFRRMIEDAKKRKFDIVLVWALDRFSREGILNTLSYLKTLKNYNISLMSLQETWLDTRQEGMGELLLAIFSWVAAQERKRLRERIVAGIRNNTRVGKRGKDKNPRRKSGYLLRWTKKTPPQKRQDFNKQK